MTTFDSRERAYEKKFAIDQDKQFKMAARGNKLLGEWAAAKLGLSRDLVNDYANAVLRAELAHTGRGALNKIRKDFDEKGLDISEAELRDAMVEFRRAALRQIEDAEAGKT